MRRQTVFFSFFVLLAINICEAQSFIRTADLFRTKIGGSRSGELNIIQDLSVDSLLSRYILANRLREGVMDGFRIWKATGITDRISGRNIRLSNPPASPNGDTDPPEGGLILFSF